MNMKKNIINLILSFALIVHAHGQGDDPQYAPPTISARYVSLSQALFVGVKAANTSPDIIYLRSNVTNFEGPPTDGEISQVSNVQPGVGFDCHAGSFWGTITEFFFNRGIRSLSPVLTFTPHKISYGHSNSRTYTKSVKLNSSINNSGNSKGRSDYTSSKLADLSLAQVSNMITVEVDRQIPILRTHAGICVWIDFNHNQIFDASELVLSHKAKRGDESAKADFKVPSNAVLGRTMMRVSTQHDGRPDPYQTNFPGEVEDYTVEIIK
jgi:GEVED domain